MDAFIGKLQPDGQVKYISVTHGGTFDTAGMCLKIFYTNEKRIDDLLSLGSLYRLGPSPYGKYVDNSNDKIHCDAYIRDNGNKPKGYRAETCSQETFFQLRECVYLYQDGNWLMKVKDGTVNISDIRYMHYAVHKTGSTLIGLEVKAVDVEHGGLKTVDVRELQNWPALVAKANENETTLFVFRANRLIATLSSKKKITN